MAAPQQHALTNTSCTFPSSHAVFSSTAGNYGGGQTASCGDLHGRLSGASNRDIQSTVYSTAAVVSQPILDLIVSRKTKPCSLCGTAALRSQSNLITNSPVSPQEQPVVLLHRLEDGLPEGDVDSLRAFGTIRLLPVHSYGGKAETDAGDSKHECDRKNQSVANHNMAPGNLAYKSFKRGSIKKLTELGEGSHNHGDLSGSLTNETKVNYGASDDHYTLEKYPGKKTIKSVKNLDIVKPEVDSGGTSHHANKRAENRACGNSVENRKDLSKEKHDALYKTVSPYHNLPSQYSADSLVSPVSPSSQSFYRLSSVYHQTPSLSQVEFTTHSAVAKIHHLTSTNSSLSQTSTSSTTDIHPHCSTSHSSFSTQDAIQHSFSPSTPMSVVCSSVVPLTTNTHSSQSQNLGSPSAISPPESPPSPPSPFSPLLMGSPLNYNHEAVPSSYSVDAQPSSPYSPCTLPSLPASPTSLPSSSDSIPSPAPSLDSPPVSPATLSGQQSEVSHNQPLRPCSDRLGDDPHPDGSASAAQSGTVLPSEAESKESKSRDHKVVSHYHLTPLPSMENGEELSNRSFIDQQVGTQVASTSQKVRTPPAHLHTPRDTCTVLQNSATKTQVDSCPENSGTCEEDKEKSVEETGHLNSDVTECFFNSESVEVEKASNDSRNSLIKLVLKVKHTGSQQLPLGSEKKEYNKESGIPKIVLTLTGKGPNKEYSCSNRIKHESESCSGENVNNKRHKSKKNKRQKPKDREKAKKIVKGDKHKRHLELFGEDSNDSCDNIGDNCNFTDYPGERRHSRTPSLMELELHTSVVPLSPEKSSSVHEENDFTPAFSENGPIFDGVKSRGSRETHPSSSPVDGSLSQYLPELKSDTPDIDEAFGDKAKDLPSMEETKEIPVSQIESVENSIRKSVGRTVEIPEDRDTELPCSELKQTEKTSETSSSILQSSETSHQGKHSEGLNLRSRRNRHAKNTESGRNSDACLWVSFGVNAPVPLPAADMPSLKPILTSKERTRMKESSATESKGHASSHEPSIGVDQKSALKTIHKECREKENAETKSEVSRESSERVFEERAKLLPAECDRKNERSHSYNKTQSSSHEGHAHFRARNHDDSTHHRHRQSNKRPLKSDESREGMTKNEIELYHKSSVDPIDKVDSENQEARINIEKGKLCTFNFTPLRVSATNGARTQSQETQIAKTPKNDDPSHQRHLQLYKKPRKLQEDREGLAEKEMESYHQDTLSPIDKNYNESQEVSTGIHKENVPTSNCSPVGVSDISDAQKEKTIAKTPFILSNVLSPNTDVPEDPSDTTPQSEENVPPSEGMDSPDRPRSFNSEECLDNQYYRPKKIRKICDTKIPRDQWHGKKYLDAPEKEKTRISATEERTHNSYINSDSPNPPSPPEANTDTPSVKHGSGLEASRCDISEAGAGKCWKPQEEPVLKGEQPKSLQDVEIANEQRKHKCLALAPQESELVAATVEEEPNEQSQPAATEQLKEEVVEKQEDIATDTLPEIENNEKQEVAKKEKEKRKKSRREKRKDSSGPGSRCSALQEAHLRREVEHEEERGRRLAQEIKGFNWLEQKIKNGSLLSSHSTPSTPTTSPATRELESTSRTQFTPTAIPSSHSTAGSKEEGPTRNKSFSGSSNATGLKGHLQTAVPPLIPPSKVTALPKRRQSLGPPVTPPCSTSSAQLCSITTVPSMTVQGALYACEPTTYRSEHRRALEKSSTDFEHENTESDKATLYSCTTTNKATLYGVKDNNFEALYHTVSANPVKYYGSATAGNTDSRCIATSPSMCFYASSKHHETGPRPQKSSSADSCFNASVISASDGSRPLKERQQDALHSPKPSHHSPRSDWSSQQGSGLNNSSHQSSGYSADSHSSQCFSHKQTLLRRAFQEMLKSEPNNSPMPQAKEKQVFIHKSSAETGMNKAVGSTPDHPSSRSTSPVHITSTNLKYRYPDSAPSQVTNKSSSEISGSFAYSSSPKSRCVSETLDREVIEPVYDANRIPSSPATEMIEIAANVTCNADPSNSQQNTKSESEPEVKESKYSDNETLKQKNDSDNKNIKMVEHPKDLQSNITDSMVSDSGGIDVKVLKDEISSKSDGKTREDAEVQPTLLLSVLYNELMKTRQEVEKLRKVQELMLTEKGEKKEDLPEQNTENKAEADQMEENATNTERTLEKRKEQEDDDDAELKIDDDKCHYHKSKRSKISIRSDLLPKEDSIALDTASSDTSASHKSAPFPQPTTTTTLASIHMVQSESEVSVITLKSSAVPETSHPSGISPSIPATSPGLLNTISGLQKLTSSLPRGHVTTGLEMSSTVLSRASPEVPGLPKTSPALPRASPGTPRSNISPGIPASPVLSSSPGVPKNSPSIPRSSPGVLRMSPGLPRANSGAPRVSTGGSVVSPGTPVVSPRASRNGLGLINNSTEASSTNTGMPNMISAPTQGNIFTLPINPSSTNTLQMLQSQSAATLAQPKMTTVQAITSPLAPIPRFPQIPITSTSAPMISPTGIRTNCIVSRTSPSISKIDTAAGASLNKIDSSLTEMSPTKLRSVFGISNSEVELMPVSIGAKASLHEPQPQTFVKLVEDPHHQATETPLLLDAVKGVFQNSGSKEVESSASHGSMPFHNLPCHEDLRRTIKNHQYEGEIKRHAFSTSDLPDHLPSVCKQPPPLKPVSTLLRRHSDNLDIHSVMHHQTMYSGTHKNLTSSLHPPNSAADLKNANSVHPFNQTQCSPAQYPNAMSGASRRRNSETNSSERSREYQQSHSMGMQHPYPHLAPGASVMRSLGPDKATIFPIPPAMPTGIRPFKPTTPPSVTRGQMEHFQNENFYRSNFSFFERIREKFAHTCDNGVNSMDRLQPPAASMEKPIQPQTFAPRVLVRESIPETSSHMPTTTFTTLHFPSINQPLPNIMPSHQNHYSGNMHPASAIHHMAQARLHPSTNQATSSGQHNSSSGSGGEKLCFYCPQPARFICSACKKAWYCSEQCQREHWSIHGAACVL